MPPMPPHHWNKYSPHTFGRVRVGSTIPLRLQDTSEDFFSALTLNMPSGTGKQNGTISTIPVSLLCQDSKEWDVKKTLKEGTEAQ